MRPAPPVGWTPRASRIGLALGLILGGSALAQDARSLSRKVPGQDLIAYAEFDGLDAHASDWKNSALYKALNETTLGALVEDLATQGIDLALKNQPGKTLPGAAQILKSAKLVVRQGFALSVCGKPPARPRFTLVVRGGANPEISGLLQETKDENEKAAKEVVKKGSRTVTTFGKGPDDDTFLEDGGDLILTSWVDLDPVIATLDGSQPSASKHPAVAELSRADGTFRPAGFAFIDTRAIPNMPPQALAAGLDGLKRVDYRWGFREQATYSVFRILAPTPRKGVLALFDSPTFDKSSLPPVPAGLEGFTVATVSPGLLFDRILAIVKQVDPNTGPHVEGMIGQVGDQIGVKIRADLLGPIGPRWSMYASGDPSKGQPIKIVALTELTDPARFAPALGKVLDVANAQMKAPRPGPPRTAAPVPQFRKLSGKLNGFELVIPPGNIPPGPMQGLKPTILIGKKNLAIGATPESATSALDVAEGSGAKWKPDPGYVPVMASLPGKMILLSLSDPRQSIPQALSSLPAMLEAAKQAMGPAQLDGKGEFPITLDPSKIPDAKALSSRLFPASSALTVDDSGLSFITRESLPNMSSTAVAATATALLLPAVQAAREAARRAQCVNHFKQIGLAFHNFESTNGRFPGNITSKDGKPLLSWRVAILPYIEEQTLYNKFKLDEPWDSPNNLPLLQSMPLAYRCPSRFQVEPGSTTYRAFTGPNTLFDGKLGASIAQITDGTSNTIAVVEAKESVPWSKPDEMPLDPNPAVPVTGPGSTHPGGYNALFCDGSVKFIKNTINAQVLRALITRAGGEVISADAY